MHNDKDYGSTHQFVEFELEDETTAEALANRHKATLVVVDASKSIEDAKDLLKALGLL